MPVNVGTLLVLMKADKSQLTKGFKEGEQASKTTAQKISANLKKIGGSLTKFVSVPLAAAGLGMIKMGADLVETLGKTDVVFGKASKSVRDWGKTTLKTFGLAEQTALDMISTYGDMSTSMGMTEDAASSMGKEIVGRAADLASFKNISIDIANTALTGIFTGETESLKQLGVIMTIANLEQFALNQGIEKTIKEMTQAEKVSLRYAFVMEKTANAAGDFARTSESVSNQTRMAKEQIKQLAANFGMLLQPAAAKVLTKVNELLESFNEMTPQGQKTILVIGGIAAALGPVLLGASKLIGAVGTIKAVLAGTTALGAGTAAAGTAAAGGAVGMGAFGAAVLAVALPVLAVVAAVGLAVGVYALFTKEARDVEKANNKLRDEMVETKTAFADNLVAAGAAADNMRELSAELIVLSRTQNKSNADIEKMKVLVGQLNTGLPRLKLNINEETGALSKNSKEIAKNIKEQEKIGKVSAAEKLLTGIQADKIKLQERINVLNDKYGVGTRKATKFTEGLTLKMGNLNQQEKALGGFLDENTEFLSANIEAQQARDSAIEKSLELTDKQKEALVQFNDDIEAAEEKHTDNMGSIFDKRISQEKININQAAKNLETQLQQFTDWQFNLEQLGLKEGVTEKMLSFLEELGPEAGILIADMVSSTDKELAKFVDVFDRRGEAIKDAAESDVTGVNQFVGRLLSDTEKIQEGSKDMGLKITQGVIEGLELGEDAAINEMIEAGSLYMDGLAIGINENAGFAIAAAQSVANEIAMVLRGSNVGFTDDLLRESANTTGNMVENLQPSVSNVNVSGTIKVDGVNSRGDLVDSAEIVTSSLNNQLQFDMRMVTP